MERVLGVLFAVLLMAEVSLLIMCFALVATLCVSLWQESPWRALVAGSIVIGSLVAAWRSEHAGVPAPTVLPERHPGINYSAIPISGAAGALYMVQFLVWALLSPAVGVFYAVLLGGGLTLVPLIYYMNRRDRGNVARVGGGAVLGMVCGLGFVAYASYRVTPLALTFGVSIGAGILVAPLLIWRRSKAQHPSIAPYGG